MDRETGHAERRRRSAGTVAVRQVYGVGAERIVRAGRAVHVVAAGNGQAAAGDLAAGRARRPLGRRRPRRTERVREETEAKGPRRAGAGPRAALGSQVLRATTVPAGGIDMLRGRV